MDNNKANIFFFKFWTPSIQLPNSLYFIMIQNQLKNLGQLNKVGQTLYYSEPSY